MNSRLDEIQAAVLNVKLKYLDKENEKRSGVAQFYLENIKSDKIILPNMPTNKKEHVWHLFVVRSANRNKVVQFLSESGIQTLVHYPIPPHRQNAYSIMSHLSLMLTDQIHNEVLSLPISPVMLETEINLVCQSLNRF